MTKKLLVTLFVLGTIAALTATYIFNGPKKNQPTEGKPADPAKPVQKQDTIVETSNSDPEKLGQQHFVIGKKGATDKLNILFIPQRVANTQTLATTIRTLFLGNTAAGKKGLLSITPFEKYSDRFNVSYLDKNIDENFFDCWLEKINPNEPPKIHHEHQCNWVKVKQYYDIYKADYIVLIHDLPVGYNSNGGEIQQLEVDAPDIINTFAHEFGHQFGGLADEYGGGSGRIADTCGTATNSNCYDSYLKEISMVPNIDQLGCPKWCKSYDLSVLLAENIHCSKHTTQSQCTATPACSWFVNKHPFLGSNCVIDYSFNTNIGKDCLENSQCIYGANYGQLAFKPNAYNIMKDMDTQSGFDYPSAQHLDKIMQCCYPRIDSAQCDNFRDQFKNLPEETNPYLAIAYTKIAHCGQTFSNCGQACDSNHLCTSGLVCTSDQICRNITCPDIPSCDCKIKICGSGCSVSANDCGPVLKCFQNPAAPPDVGYCRNPNNSNNEICSEI